MRVLLAVAALVVVVGAATVSEEDKEFESWKQEHGKSYGSEEEESQRKMSWLTSRKLVLEHNKLAEQGLESYTLEMNEFADMEDQEFQDMYTGSLDSMNETETNTHCASTFTPENEEDTLPSSVDWRTAGYVTGVKSQRRCASGWAFSATGALEGQMYRRTRRLIPLSEQQLIDCSGSYGNHGCHGGLAIRAFWYVMHKGLESGHSYPYWARKSRSCYFEPWKVKATCRGMMCLPRGNEGILKYAVARIGPISVSVDASRRSFRLYKSGVYYDHTCSNHHMNHGVLLIGYGRSGSRSYWLVKNSWGTWWGEHGYIRMSRNKGNQCGIATRPVFPIV
ncbi:procathepsin L-like [Astyanax mexicanus]|uniref:procathepsin L-like n=1 Tax=Astyanax mexicanus TaxID=7994 RepID=UPI0020CA9CA0|nr:procathepsin L-like [Astyanax mexicanus]